MNAAHAKYTARLSGLSGMKGRRNAALLGIVNLGIMAGLPDDRILADVRAASGTPPLTDGEITHATRTARRDTIALTDRPQATKWTPPKPKPPPLGTKAVSFVGRMIERGHGATFDTLAASSPMPLPDTPNGQLGAYLSLLHGVDAFLFCGQQTDRGEIGRTVRTVDDWLAHFFSAKADVPPLVTCNPLTGREGLTKEGKPSYRCRACVAAYRFALVEFDAMPLSDQYAFWAGVIASGVLPLRSLVYSGGKSIHGLVEVGARNAAAWEKEIDTLLFATCNPKARKEHQADRACRNADRLTRLAGAPRPDKGKVQSLLWLSQGPLWIGPRIAPTPECTQTAPEASEAVLRDPGESGGALALPRCRDCWNWTPNGIKHGCAAGGQSRPSPDWRGECRGFVAVFYGRVNN